MSSKSHLCPCCNREFKGIFDYPRVLIISFEMLPIPEALDYHSAEAAKKRSKITAEDISDPSRIVWRGINMTPEISRACEQADVKEYLEKLSGLTGNEISPKNLLPSFKSHSIFKWAYPVQNTNVLLSLKDDELPSAEEGIAKIKLHCQGRNLGSAGGPTLQPLGAIALLKYKGLLSMN